MLIVHMSLMVVKQRVRLLLEEPDIRVKAALVTDLCSGMRKGELLGLTWEKILFNKFQIQVHEASQYVSGNGIDDAPTKNDSSYRSIDVFPLVMDVLKEYKLWWDDYRQKLGDNWVGDKDMLFIQANGKPLFPDTINYWLSEFCKKHGLDHIHPHGLRHTYASIQLAYGVDVRTLAGQTGHARPSTLTDTYAHDIPSAQVRATLTLEEILLGSAYRAEECVKNNSPKPLF